MGSMNPIAGMSSAVSSKRVSSLWAFVVVVSAAKRNGCRCRNRLFIPIKEIDDDNDNDSDNEQSRWMNETQSLETALDGIKAG